MNIADYYPSCYGITLVLSRILREFQKMMDDIV